MRRLGSVSLHRPLLPFPLRHDRRSPRPSFQTSLVVPISPPKRVVIVSTVESKASPGRNFRASPNRSRANRPMIECQLAEDRQVARCPIRRSRVLVVVWVLESLNFAMSVGVLESLRFSMSVLFASSRSSCWARCRTTDSFLDVRFCVPWPL
jgi:hypothetical protein